MLARWRGTVVLLLAVAVCMAPSALYAAQAREILKVGVGDLSGVIKDSRGAVLADVSVRLVKDGKVVQKTATDENGVYSLEKLEAGEYTMQIGSDRELGFASVESSKVTTLGVVVPSQGDYGAAALSLTETQWVWVAVGTAALVAVVIPVLYNTTNVFGDNDHDSP